MGDNKSICWVKGECPYLSGLTSFEDISISTCSRCSRFKENRELLLELLGDEFGGEWFDDEKIGIIFSLLETLLEKFKDELSQEDRDSLNEILFYQ